MKSSGITWNEASFKEYIKNPKAKVPGTKMVFQGLPVGTGRGRCVGLSFGLWRRRQKEVTGATNAPDCESGPPGPLFLCEGA